MDIQYLLNKDTLYYSVYTLLANRWGRGDTLDEGFTWDRTHVVEPHGGRWRTTSARRWRRSSCPPDAYAEHVAANVQVVEGWLQAHPETEFDLFLPPYSILFWDRVIRESRQTRSLPPSVRRWSGCCPMRK